MVLLCHVNGVFEMAACPSAIQQYIDGKKRAIKCLAPCTVISIHFRIVSSQQSQTIVDFHFIRDNYGITRNHFTTHCQHLHLLWIGRKLSNSDGHH